MVYSVAEILNTSKNYALKKMIVDYSRLALDLLVILKELGLLLEIYRAGFKKCLVNKIFFYNQNFKLNLLIIFYHIIFIFHWKNTSNFNINPFNPKIFI